MAGKHKNKGKKRVIHIDETRALLAPSESHQDQLDQSTPSEKQGLPVTNTNDTRNVGHLKNLDTTISTSIAPTNASSTRSQGPDSSPHTLESFGVFPTVSSSSSKTSNNTAKRNYLAVQRPDLEQGETDASSSRPVSPAARRSIDFGRHADEDIETAAKRKQGAMRAIGAIFVIISLVFGLCIFFIVRHAFSPDPSSFPSDKIVIYISLDGFRPEYLSRSLTPTLSSFARSGVSAKSMIPSFPSITFPNHYTLVTGLYPESHGIVGNKFYDPITNGTFSYTSPDCNIEPYWWSRAEPIWITAVKQGYRSATCMWPGSEAPHDGLKATYSLPYSDNMTAMQEIEQIIQWISLPSDQRPHLITAYLHDVDAQGHAAGVESVNGALGRIDLALAKLNQSVVERGLRDTVDFVIVSDHGMTDVSADRLLLLDDYINLDRVVFLYDGVIVGMYPKDGNDLDDVFKTLRTASVKDGRFQVWKKEDLPEQYHYSKSDRIPPIVLLPQLGWVFDDKRRTWPFTLRGAHGYLNTDPDMHAIFIAHGPSFRKAAASSVIPSFPNVQAYEIVARLLKMTPLKNNGSSIWTKNFVRHFLE